MIDQLADGEALELLWSALANEATVGFPDPASESGASDGDGDDAGRDKLDILGLPRAPEDAPDSELMIDYAGYNAAARVLEPKVAALLTPAAFYRFRSDPLGRVPVELVYEYAVGRASLRKTRIMLAAHDTEGSGYLTEVDMERFIMQSVKDLPCLAALDPTFEVFYVCTAVRKFMFFLDPLRMGRVAIKSILLSPVLSEFFELEDQPAEAALVPDEIERSRGASGAPSGPPTNWFSLFSARRIYADYLRLDTDQNGMLSRSELAAFGSRTLTPTFLDRVFEECHTYGGEMDFKTYVDFVLAMENKSEPQALSWLFRILDISKTGALSYFELNVFFKDVLAEMAAAGYPLVRKEDVMGEIFDMVKPAHPTRITLDDLIASGVGGTVVNILTDVAGFWAYDNREMLLST
ncbi:phosphatase 2 [Thecamonas trahens ATCC 50062]|uniref:Phosphatase 2 n=1 Tax=Thecamonas trahens ATCC 50062 TaxID=461836 RepID=A0A0L0DVX7_THETB|nr:phosphatase 2 [Thecamonas trahens ATCC 50062]KNC56474.1 phosphatase 2 [Thecamonas trahens ATCC 50062]|eukprot:XP_013760983.1 phosphatase 2 [Thecamonas trahens ATCC 50062]